MRPLPVGKRRGAERRHQVPERLPRHHRERSHSRRRRYATSAGGSRHQGRLAPVGVTMSRGCDAGREASSEDGTIAGAMHRRCDNGSSRSWIVPNSSLRRHHRVKERAIGETRRSTQLRGARSAKGAELPFTKEDVGYVVRRRRDGVQPVGQSSIRANAPTSSRATPRIRPSSAPSPTAPRPVVRGRRASSSPGSTAAPSEADARVRHEERPRTRPVESVPGARRSLADQREPSLHAIHSVAPKDSVWMRSA
jgi:hypothetical protein